VGAESWTLEDYGVLHGKGLTMAYGYLESEKDYKDFQLSFALQVCWRREQRRLLSYGCQAELGRCHAGHAV
jgi:hypothetical protein